MALSKPSVDRKAEILAYLWQEEYELVVDDGDYGYGGEWISYKRPNLELIAELIEEGWP